MADTAIPDLLTQAEASVQHLAAEIGDLAQALEPIRWTAPTPDTSDTVGAVRPGSSPLAKRVQELIEYVDIQSRRVHGLFSTVEVSGSWDQAAKDPGPQVGF